MLAEALALLLGNVRLLAGLETLSKIGRAEGRLSGSDPSCRFGSAAGCDDPDFDFVDSAPKFKVLCRVGKEAEVDLDIVLVGMRLGGPMEVFDGPDVNVDVDGAGRALGRGATTRGTTGTIGDVLPSTRVVMGSPEAATAARCSTRAVSLCSEGRPAVAAGAEAIGSSSNVGCDTVVNVSGLGSASTRKRPPSIVDEPLAFAIPANRGVAPGEATAYAPPARNRDNPPRAR